MWKNLFSIILCQTFDYYNINKDEFTTTVNQFDISTLRYWLLGRNLPSQIYLKYLFVGLHDYIESSPKHTKHNVFKEDILKIFEEYGCASMFEELIDEDPADFVELTLHKCYLNHKSNVKILSKKNINLFTPTNKTQAVVFDFDGTLTIHNNKTTWEELWEILGYNIRECQDLHNCFNRNEITHKEWVYITEQKFKEKKLTRKQVVEIAKNIILINDIKEVFEKLQKEGIKIYIVSGSILTIIQTALGELCQYVDVIKANNFIFDNNNHLKKIIGTKYDFNGKAKFISQVANNLEISTKDILFIGNSINDRFAYLSGAQTLCINPRYADISNLEVWNYTIYSTTTLKDILKRIRL